MLFIFLELIIKTWYKYIQKTLSDFRNMQYYYANFMSLFNSYIFSRQL